MGGWGGGGVSVSRWVGSGVGCVGVVEVGGRVCR